MASMNQKQILQYATHDTSSFGISPYQMPSAKIDKRPISEAQQAIRQALHSNLN